MWLFSRLATRQPREINHSTILSHLRKNNCYYFFTTNWCPNRTQMTLKNLHDTLLTILKSIAKKTPLSERELGRLREAALLELAAMTKDPPSAEIFENVVMARFRADHGPTLQEEFGLIKWLAEDVDPLNPWSAPLLAVKKSLRTRIVEAEEAKELKGEADPGSELDAGDEDVAEDPLERLSDDVPRRARKSKKELLVETMLKALGVATEDLDDDEEDHDVDVGAKKPRKVLVKMKEGEKLMDFSLTFKIQMEDWRVGLNSRLAKEYFASAIEDRAEIRSMFVDMKFRHPTWSLGEIIAELIKLVDDISKESVSRDFNRLLQKKGESVVTFYARFSRIWKIYAFFYELARADAETELVYFRDRLREETARALKLHERAGVCKTMEDLIEVVKIIEAADGIKSPSVNASVKEDRYKDRSGKGSKKTKKLPPKGPLGGADRSSGKSSAGKTATKEDKKKHEHLPFYLKVGVCWGCGLAGVKYRECPECKRMKADDKKELIKEVNTVSIDPSRVAKLPIANVELETGEEDPMVIACLLDIGSELTLARPELKRYATSTCLDEVGFSGVGSSDASKERETLKVKWGTTWMGIETHFVSSIPKGMDMILGLDNNLSSVDLTKGEASIGRHSFVFQIHEDTKTPEERAARGDPELLALLNRFKGLFAGSDKYYPLSKLPPVRIELLPEARPVKVPPHKMAPDDEQMVEDEIAEMAAKGILKKVKNPKWTFPFFVAKGKGWKKNKKRTAVDFRRLNPVLRVVDYPTPTVDELIESVPLGFDYISSLDIAKAYLQNSVDDPAGCLTIRGPRSGHWHFESLPLGVAAAVALFQRQIEQLIGEDLIAAGVRVYLDDILIFSKTRTEHFALLERVFKRLESVGLRIRLEKCVFLQGAIEYLGYYISGGNIEISSDRIQALIDAPAPTNGSEVRGFLGGLVMLRRFDPRIADKTYFMNSLINAFNWGGEEEKAFQELKDCLIDLLLDARNFRMDSSLPLIVETDASKKALGAALVQEAVVNGVKERRLIYAASRSLKSAETRYSTIRRELLGVKFAITKFRKFLLGTHFIVRTDHRPLDGLFKKAIMSIENEDLRDLVASLSNYDFEVEYLPGESNAFPDWLSRCCVDELYSYPDFRLHESGKFYEVWSRKKWRRFVPAEERRAVMNSLHTFKHLGYTRIMNAANDACLTWPRISEDVQEFLIDCGCSLSKKNRRKRLTWGTPAAVYPSENSIAVDLYSYGGKHFLSILDLNSDEFWSMEVWEKSSECIMDLLTTWAESLDLPLESMTFLSDRGGEFAELSAYIKKHVRTASYHPEANGKVERRHKELGMMCRLYECEPPAVAEMWRCGAFGVHQIKKLPDKGELVLRYVQRKGPKSADCWEGPMLVQDHQGASMVRCLNLETRRTVYVHLNDLKLYKRPCTVDWRLNDKVKALLGEKLNVDWIDFESRNLSESWKGKDVFVDISSSADLEVIFAKALKELPRRMLIVVPEWKERSFFDLHEAIPGEFTAIPNDADAFLENGEATGFRIWNSWFGVYLLKDLKETAKTGDWIRRMLAGVEGEVCYLEAPEEPEEADSTLGEEARVMSVQGMTPNDSKHCKR